MLTNVGSGGGAAPAAAGGAGGAAAGGDAPAEAAKEEEKEEGTHAHYIGLVQSNIFCREGRIRRGHGFRSIRLNNFTSYILTYLASFRRTCLSCGQMGYIA